jgi:hypothetical protein
VLSTLTGAILFCVESGQVLPRWFILRKIAIVIGSAAGIYLYLWGAIYRMASWGPDRIPAAYFAFAAPSTAQIILLVPLALCALLFIRVLRDYTLRENEQYLILVMLALVLFTWFGVANYVIYAHNPDTFAVDKELLNELSISQEREWKLMLSEAQENVEACDIILQALRAGQEKDLKALVSSNDYRLQLPQPPATIDVHLALDPDEDEHLPRAVYRVTAKAANRTVLITRDEGILRGSPGGFSLGMHLYFEKNASVAELIQLFQRHKEWEIANWITPMQRTIARRPVPLTLFLYQALMDTVGANPKYFSPKTFSSRAIAFIYAFFKLVFFGMVITVFAKQLASGAATKADASAK